MERPEALHRSGHERGHLGAIRNVHANPIYPVAAPACGHDFIDCFLPHVCSNDRRAFVELASDGGRADTAAGTRYQDRLLVKAFHAQTPLFQHEGVALLVRR